MNGKPLKRSKLIGSSIVIDNSKAIFASNVFKFTQSIVLVNNREANTASDTQQFKCNDSRNQIF